MGNLGRNKLKNKIIFKNVKQKKKAIYKLERYNLEKKYLLPLKLKLNYKILKLFNERDMIDFFLKIKQDSRFVNDKLIKVLNIKRIKQINNYKAYRLKNKLPMRGQRTHTNASTRKTRNVY